MLNLHYIAGIIDGEGHLGLHWNENNRTAVICVAVSMVSPIVPLALHKQYGGHLYVDNSPGRKSRNSRPTTKWAVKSFKAAVFLEQVKDLLLLKDRQAHILLTFQELLHGDTPMDVETKLLFKGLIHKLNKTGIKDK